MPANDDTWGSAGGGGGRDGDDDDDGPVFSWRGGGGGGDGGDDDDDDGPGGADGPAFHPGVPALLRDNCKNEDDYSTWGMWFTFFILYCNFIPLSLYVTIEMINYGQARSARCSIGVADGVCVHCPPSVHWFCGTTLWCLSRAVSWRHARGCRGTKCERTRVRRDTRPTRLSVNTCVT